MRELWKTFHMILCIWLKYFMKLCLYITFVLKSLNKDLIQDRKKKKEILGFRFPGGVLTDRSSDCV